MKLTFKFFLLSFLAVGFFSCQGVVEDLNDDPNNPQDAPAALMITGLQAGNVLVHEGELTRLVGMWSGYFTGSDRQYIGLDKYDVTAGDFDSPWGIVYADVLSQARIAQAKAADAKDNTLLGIAQVIEAHAVGSATALWGDIPYSQAANVEQFPEPAYDSQRAIYESLQTLLDEAIVNLDGVADTGSEVTDFVNTNWVEVANTLKARYYLHTGNYADAATAAAAGIQDGAWMANHDVAGYTDGRFNLIFSFCIWNREGYMTAQDAHLALMLDPVVDTYRGNSKTDETARFGYYYNQWGWYGANYDPHWWSGGMFWRSEGYPLVTSAENNLIMAEAQARLSENTNAIDALNAHRAALDVRYGGGGDSTYMAYDIADFDAGGMLNDGGTANEEILTEILEEKYVSMYGQIEGFNDLRRTNNAIAVPIKAGNTAFPERIVYPQSEVNSNSNVPSPLPTLFEPTEVNN